MELFKIKEILNTMDKSKKQVCLGNKLFMGEN
jgi:hypothetical protein